jgi:hypothetical protein
MIGRTIHNYVVKLLGQRDLDAAIRRLELK